jgi:subtilisin
VLPPDSPLVVVDMVGDAALVEVPSGAGGALRGLGAEVRVAPMVRYQLALARPQVLARPSGALTAGVLDVVVVSASDGQPLTDATVLAFTDYAARMGSYGRSRKDGTLRLAIGSAPVVERVYVLGAVGHWSLLRRRVDPGRPLRLVLHPFDHRQPDGRGYRVGTPRLTAGHGVRIGLVDTGVARDHPDVVVAAGRNCVTGEDPSDYGPNGHEHGTHVAGIVAGRGRAPTGRRGVAPGAELRSYRAFGQGYGEATSFAIAKALDAAVQDGCDVVNLSLGGGGADPVVRAAVEEAQEAGVVVVAAAGNDGRAPVAFPADLPDVVAVSALGRTGTFPRTAGGAAERRGPYGRDGADFVAAFSNIGAIDVTAPGVGIVSTVPGGYLDLDGTSMACPFVTGILARTLSSSRRLRALPRSPERAARLLAVLHRRARSLGFPPSLEGDGLAR